MIETHHLLIPRGSDRKYNIRQTMIVNKYGFIVILWTGNQTQPWGSFVLCFTVDVAGLFLQKKVRKGGRSEGNVM